MSVFICLRAAGVGARPGLMLGYQKSPKPDPDTRSGLTFARTTHTFVVRPSGTC